MEFFKCAVCGEPKNMDPYIAPRGIHCGEEICKNCYESEFGAQYGIYHICARCGARIQYGHGYADDNEYYYCDECVGTVIRECANPDGEHNEILSDESQTLSDLIDSVYALNDSVKDLTSLLRSKL